MKWTRSAAAGRGAEPVVVHRVEERVQVPELAGRPALELAAARRDLPQAVDVARAAGRPRSARALRGRSRSRRPRGARPGRGRPRAATPPAAGRRPSRRSACRRSSRSGRGSGRARRSTSGGALLAAPAGGRARGRAAPGPARADGTRARPRPAGRGACAPRSEGSSASTSNSEFAGVLASPRARRLAPRIPSSAYGRKRSGCGRTVYSSALPWIFTAYGAHRRRRARITGPMTRWLASATSGVRHRAHGLDVRRRCSARARRRSAPGRAWRRSPRTCRPRRPAAPARCPACATVTPSGGSQSRSWQSRCTSWPSRGERPHQVGVVDVAAGAAQQVAVEDQDPHVAAAIVPRRCPPARSTACAPAPTARSSARSSRG